MWYDRIVKFSEKHPVLKWILARLLIVVCICNIIVVALFTMGLIFGPFLIEEGSGLVPFTAWLWVPVLVTIVWIMGEVVGMLIDNFLD